MKNIILAYLYVQHARTDLYQFFSNFLWNEICHVYVLDKRHLQKNRIHFASFCVVSKPFFTSKH